MGTHTRKLTVRRLWNRYWSFVVIGLLFAAIAAVVLSIAAGASEGEEVVLERAMSGETETVTRVQTISELMKVDESVFSEEPVYLSVPAEATAQKTYMDYRTITDQSTVQWQLQQLAGTNEYGFREIDGMYLVAMGTYYSDHAGSMFRITLENGTVFDVIMGDVKDDQDTDATNRHRNGNVVEFIVDTDQLHEDARLMGDVSYTPGAGLLAPVQSIQYLGEFFEEVE